MSMSVCLLFVCYCSLDLCMSARSSLLVSYTQRSKWCLFAFTHIHSRLGVLETGVLVSRHLETHIYKSLRLDLGTRESRSRSWSWYHGDSVFMTFISYKAKAFLLSFPSLKGSHIHRSQDSWRMWKGSVSPQACRHFVSVIVKQTCLRLVVLLLVWEAMRLLRLRM